MKGAVPMDFVGKNEYNKEKIAYQNKDIASKVLAENFKGKTFRVYGLDLPDIRHVLPTNIPVIKANELRLDNLFALADNSVALVDYESEYRKEDKIKYLNYLTGIANRYLKEKKVCPKLRMIVIYTGDIKRKNIDDEFDLGAVKVSIETAFLSELDSESIYRELQSKVSQGQMLSDEELMKFIILPLSYKKKSEKEIQLERIIDLAIHIQDKEQQLFTLSGILVFADKIINMEMAGRIRRAIEMTKVAQIFEEEKRQAIEKTTQELVLRMLKKNYPPEEISQLVTGYSVEDIEELRKKMQI